MPWQRARRISQQCVENQAFVFTDYWMRGRDEPIAGPKHSHGLLAHQRPFNKATCYYGSLAYFGSHLDFVVVFLFQCHLLVMLSQIFWAFAPQDVLVGFGSYISGHPACWVI